jgi:hypothetical protein
MEGLIALETLTADGKSTIDRQIENKKIDISIKGGN